MIKALLCIGTHILTDNFTVISDMFIRSENCVHWTKSNKHGNIQLPIQKIPTEGIAVTAIGIMILAMGINNPGHRKLDSWLKILISATNKRFVAVACRYLDL